MLSLSKTFFCVRVQEMVVSNVGSSGAWQSGPGGRACVDLDHKHPAAQKLATLTVPAAPGRRPRMLRMQPLQSWGIALPKSGSSQNEMALPSFQTLLTLLSYFSKT